MKDITKPLINTLTLVAAIFVNYWANTGRLNGKQVGEVSAKYETLFTPADYAFSIWGFIYLTLLMYVGYQWYQYGRNHRPGQLKSGGYWFTMSNIANGCWVLAWLNEYTGLSVVIMLVLLYSLIRLVISRNLERWDAPLDVIVFVWWPITFYLGWIIVATVSNVASFLVSIGWTGAPFGEPLWAVLMIAVAAGIYMALTYKRYMREASVVGAWGLAAIVVEQWNNNWLIAGAAIVAALAVLVTSGYQGFKNRHMSALGKMHGA